MNDMSLVPQVRVKYLSAWHMIQHRYRSVLDVLEGNGFNPRAICDIDWGPPFAKIGTEHGFFQ
jgi:hypothetical protein